MSEFQPFELTAEEWFRVVGRGWIAAIDGNTLPPQLWTGENLLHLVVKIDGDLYHIKGVERFAIARSPETFGGKVKRYTDNFALLVKPIGHEKHAHTWTE